MNHERRQQPRFLQVNAVVLQVTITDESGEQTTIECSTEDVSTKGIRILADRELPIGLITEVCISNQAGQSMLLYAELRWQKQTQHGYDSGFQLLDAEFSDLDHWIDQVKREASKTSN